MNWYKKITAVNFDLSKKEDSECDSKQLEMGEKEELEHTSNKEIAKSIAKDHLGEIPNYYTELKKMEEKLNNK
jgi:hypothetical protein